MAKDKVVLVVVSKVKKLAKDAGLNMSSEVMEFLTDGVEAQVQAAIQKAKADGLKTVKLKHFTDSDSSEE